jgi:type IV secretory pathway TrbD component
MRTFFFKIQSYGFKPLSIAGFGAVSELLIWQQKVGFTLWLISQAWFPTKQGSVLWVVAFSCID